MSDVGPRTEVGKRLLGMHRQHRTSHESFTEEGLRELIAAIEAEAGPLDAAWAEVKAALPEWWVLMKVSLENGSRPERGWIAVAGPPTKPDGSFTLEHSAGEGDTPAAALHALTAKLREHSAE
jgi:hypothetical protein